MELGWYNGTLNYKHPWFCNNNIPQEMYIWTDNNKQVSNNNITRKVDENMAGNFLDDQNKHLQ